MERPLRLSLAMKDRCQMNSGRRYCQRLLGGTILSLVVVLLGGCDITQPSEDPWSDLNSFSWRSGTTLRYRVERWSLDGGTVDTVELVGRDSIGDNAEIIHVLEKTPPDALGSTSIQVRTQKDTLIVIQGDLLPANIQLVSPLVVKTQENNHTWYAQFGGPPGSTPIPTWEAQILERYTRKIIGGREYQYVLEVRYRSLKDDERWVRYFAKGIGPVLTRQYNELVPGSGVQPTQEHTLLPD